MKQLKEQTVYIEHSIANKLTEPFENMNYGYVTHLELSNQICLSKDELIELLTDAIHWGVGTYQEQLKGGARQLTLKFNIIYQKNFLNNKPNT